MGRKKGIISRRMNTGGGREVNDQQPQKTERKLHKRLRASHRLEESRANLNAGRCRFLWAQGPGGSAQQKGFVLSENIPTGMNCLLRGGSKDAQEKVDP